MKTQTWWVVATLAIVNVPVGLAQGEDSEEGGPLVSVTIEAVVPPTPTCSWQTVGDKVGYNPGALVYGELALGFQLVNSDVYNARGIFDSQGQESHGGKTYDVFTITSGFSEKADWCDDLGNAVAEASVEVRAEAQVG